MKKLFFVVVFFTILASFTSLDRPKVEIVKSNIALDQNQFELSDGTYFIHHAQFESLYVEVSSTRISGKEYNPETYKIERIKGSRYELIFFETCNQKGSKLTQRKTFITVWDNGKIDAWRTNEELMIDEYHLTIKPKK